MAMRPPVISVSCVSAVARYDRALAADAAALAVPCAVSSSCLALA